jgi:putative peptidoglycan lipid II flippase
MIAALVAYLSEWKRGSAHRRVASAALVVAAFTLAGKVVSAAREVILAYRFGTTDEVDAFVLASTLPGFAMVVISGSFNTALLPAYVEVRQREGAVEAQRLLSTTVVVSLVLLVAAGAILSVVQPLVLPLLGSHFAPAKVLLTVKLSFLLLPGLVVSGLTTTWSGVLHAHGKFAAPAGASLAVPLTSIAALLLFGRTWGILSLVAGMFAGFLAEAVLVGFALRRVGLSLRPRWEGATPHVRRVVGQYAPMAAGMLVMGLNPLIDNAMAARLAPGSVASLGYGSKLVGFAMGIGTVSLSAAVFPHFSALAASRDWSGLQKTLRTYAALVLAVTIPATIAAVLLSNPIVGLLYQRGAFTSGDTQIVGRMQALYVLQVPFHLTGMLFVRFLSATSGNRILMWISIATAVINVAGNYAFSAWIGPPGIALSTSVVYVSTFVMLYLNTRRRLRMLRGG